MDRIRKYGKQSLYTGLFFGVGLAVGGLFSSLLFNIVTLQGLADRGDAVRLAIGIILALVISGLGAGIGGMIGGYWLPIQDKYRKRLSYSWRSGISLGLPMGLLLYPVLLVISIVSFFSEGIPLTTLLIILLIFGLLYGLMSSLLLGALTVGRRGYAPVVWMGLIGFGFGGLALGYCLWHYLMSINPNDVRFSTRVWLVLGLFLFGLFGGTSWGFAFYRLASEGRKVIHQGFSKLRFVIISLILIGLVYFIRPVFAAVGDVLTPQSAGLALILNSDTVGTHWSNATSLASSGAANLQIAADGDQLALTWEDSDMVYLATGIWDHQAYSSIWKDPIPVSGGGAATAPQVAFGGDASPQLIWVEDGAVWFAACTDSACSEPVKISGDTAPACAGAVNIATAPALIVNNKGESMAVWLGDNGSILFTTWLSGAAPPASPQGCIAGDVQASGQPRLGTGDDGRFHLVYDSGGQDGGEIYHQAYDGSQWQPPALIGQGQKPSVAVDANGQISSAWCDLQGQLVFWQGGVLETVSALPCITRPEVGFDSLGQVHLTWISNRIEKNTGQFVDMLVLYESIRLDSEWTSPAIVTTLSEEAQPALAESMGDLHLAWKAGDALQTASQIQYNCEGNELDDVSQAMFDVARLARYRADDYLIPYCRNRYDRLIVAPNPEPAYSHQPQTTNGAFDVVFELVREAKYEVLFTNMWYDADLGESSPGYLLAEAVADLYDNLAANPEQYPRGITVRILLGNPPEFTKGKVNGQIWNVLNDLRDAGVPEMENTDLGWLVEVANFEGTLPHSHIKSVIVDGRTVIAAGFNMTYDHLPADHPSGNGGGRFDLAGQVTGPVAQDSRVMFDDMWQGSNRLHCHDLYSRYLPWQTTCSPRPAISDHVPEVMSYYLPGGDSTVFSMYRNAVRDEADQQVIAALKQAKETIDIVHVNFTMEMVCDLNLIYDQVCTPANLLPFAEAIIEAVEQNNVKVRVLIKDQPIDGVESGVNLVMLREKFAELGLLENVELRFFNGPMHSKATLIDNEFLIVGSQNYHYSAFGQGSGLAEYSMGIQDPQAVEDFRALYEYYWQDGIKP